MKIRSHSFLLSLLIAAPLCAMESESPFTNFPEAEPAKSRHDFSSIERLEKRFTNQTKRLEKRFVEERFAMLSATQMALMQERRRTETLARELATATETIARQLAISTVLLDQRRGEIEEARRVEERRLIINAACEQAELNHTRKIILAATASGALTGFVTSSGKELLGSKVLGRVAGTTTGALIGFLGGYHTASLDRLAFDIVKQK